MCAASPIREFPRMDGASSSPLPMHRPMAAAPAIWVVDVLKNTSRQLTRSAAGDKAGEHQGRWLQDAVLFLAKRGEHTQLFRLPMEGGEAQAFDLSIAPPVDASLEADAIPPRAKPEPAANRDPLPLDVDVSFKRHPMGARLRCSREILKRRARRNKRRTRPMRSGSIMICTVSGCTC